MKKHNTIKALSEDCTNIYFKLRESNEINIRAAKVFHKEHDSLVEIEINKGGLLYLASRLLDLASKDFEGAHEHFDRGVNDLTEDSDVDLLFTLTDFKGKE